MRNLILVAIVLLFSRGAFALSAPATTEAVPYTASGIHFDFASQDGELNYGCTQILLQSSGDLAVTCSRPEAPKDVWKFTVHLRLFKHERATVPKLSYELLYWVTDEQLIGGHQGQFIGSTIWFNFAEPAPLMSLDAGQDIENTMVLRMHIEL